MDRELAQMVLMTSLRARIDLGDLMPILKEHADAEKAESVRLAIASAIYELGVVLERVFEQFPDLQTECETRRKKYKRPYY